MELPGSAMMSGPKHETMSVTDTDSASDLLPGALVTRSPMR